jgi:hypothetical protein
MVGWNAGESFNVTAELNHFSVMDEVQRNRQRTAAVTGAHVGCARARF